MSRTLDIFMEVATRLKLWDASTKMYVYEAVLLYSDPSRSARTFQAPAARCLLTPLP